MITMNKIIASTLLLFLISSITGCEKKPTTPTAAFNITKKSILNKNWDKYWFMLSKKSKENFNDQVKYMQDNFGKLAPEARKKMLNSMGMTEKELNELDGRNFFLNAMSIRDKEQETAKSSSLALFKTSKVIYVEESGDKAILYIQDDLGHEVKIPVVKENKLWKLDLSEFD